MNDISTRFFCPRLPVTIVNLADSGSRSQSFRSFLEDLGCSVTVHHIGTPGDFLLVLKEAQPRYLLIVGHGCEEGLYFGEYGPRIDVSMLQNGYLPAASIAPHVNLPGTLVILECCTGSAVAEPMLQGGASAVIASPVVMRNSFNLFVVHFFYSLREKNMTDREAFDEAHRAVAPTPDQPIHWYDSPSSVNPFGP